eukprot:scaffold56557_cov27-Tisochrysis_lutea.AAC.3
MSVAAEAKAVAEVGWKYSSRAPSAVELSRDLQVRSLAGAGGPLRGLGATESNIGPFTTSSCGATQKLLRPLVCPKRLGR